MISFFFVMKFLFANSIAPDGMLHSAAFIWGYSVYLCPIKRMPGLYELIYLKITGRMNAKYGYTRLIMQKSHFHTASSVEKYNYRQFLTLIKSQ